eukprot:gene17864-24254_t
MKPASMSENEEGVTWQCRACCEAIPLEAGPPSTSLPLHIPNCLHLRKAVSWLQARCEAVNAERLRAAASDWFQVQRPYISHSFLLDSRGVGFLGILALERNEAEQTKNKAGWQQQPGGANTDGKKRNTFLEDMEAAEGGIGMLPAICNLFQPGVSEALQCVAALSHEAVQALQHLQGAHIVMFLQNNIQAALSVLQEPLSKVLRQPSIVLEALRMLETQHTVQYVLLDTEILLLLQSVLAESQPLLGALDMQMDLGLAWMWGWDGPGDGSEAWDLGWDGSGDGSEHGMDLGMDLRHGSGAWIWGMDLGHGSEDGMDLGMDLRHGSVGWIWGMDLWDGSEDGMDLGMDLRHGSVGWIWGMDLWDGSEDGMDLGMDLRHGTVGWIWGMGLGHGSEDGMDLGIDVEEVKASLSEGAKQLPSNSLLCIERSLINLKVQLQKEKAAPALIMLQIPHVADVLQHIAYWLNNHVFKEDCDIPAVFHQGLLDLMKKPGIYQMLDVLRQSHKLLPMLNMLKDIHSNSSKETRKLLKEGFRYSTLAGLERSPQSPLRSVARRHMCSRLSPKLAQSSTNSTGPFPSNFCSGTPVAVWPDVRAINVAVLQIACVQCVPSSGSTSAGWPRPHPLLETTCAGPVYSAKSPPKSKCAPSDVPPTSPRDPFHANSPALAHRSHQPKAPPVFQLPPNPSPFLSNPFTSDSHETHSLVSVPPSAFLSPVQATQIQDIRTTDPGDQLGDRAIWAGTASHSGASGELGYLLQPRDSKGRGTLHLLTHWLAVEALLHSNEGPAGGGDSSRPATSQANRRRNGAGHGPSNGHQPGPGPDGKEGRSQPPRQGVGDVPGSAQGRWQEREGDERSAETSGQDHAPPGGTGIQGLKGQANGAPGLARLT